MVPGVRCRVSGTAPRHQIPLTPGTGHLTPQLSVHDPSVPQLNHPLAVSRVRLRVGHLHDRRSRAVQLREQLHDLLPLTRVEIAGRLVGEDQGRLVNQRARHRDELLLAARELPRKEVLLRDDPKAVERVGDERVALALLDVAVRQRHIEVLRHREIVEQVVLLEHEPDVLLVERHTVLGLHLVHRVVEEAVFTRPVAVEHAEDGEQRGLPRPGWTHDRDELARGDVDRNLPQDEEPAVPLGDGLVEGAKGDHRGSGPYSRSATVGASLEARRAGNHVASTLAKPSTPMASANDDASNGVKPYSSAAAYRSVTPASTRPMAKPIANNTPHSANIMRMMVRGAAPSAMRTPISIRRRVTRYDITPYSPIAATSMARTPKHPDSQAIKRSVTSSLSM